jgi:FAD:protein FMN transferase
MGVEARLVLYSPAESAAIEAAEAAFARIKALEQCMSDWRATSELSHLCERAGLEAVVVSQDLFDVLARANEIAEASDGAFDVTVAPLVKLWRAARKSGTLPSDADLERARALVGWHDLKLDREHLRAQLTRAGMRLDLGAIGKGVACDRALRVLRDHGVSSALVQMGGDLACSDAPPDRPGWTVDLAAGAATSHGERLAVSNRCVSTSGDTEQFVEIGGQHYSHVVDPRTGLALTSRVRVIVLAPDGATADALSTAIGVLGPSAGLALAARFEGVAARVEELLGDRVVVHQSANFE